MREWQDLMNRIVIGILAHVDSGKTTLSESILYKTGVLRSLGRVDHETSFLDSNEIERERGITIFSSQAVFTRRDIEFTLIDTPGHVDFSAETERALNILDTALLVISGTEGVQSHTETLWQLLETYRVPTFIFVNKMDISHSSRRQLMCELKARFGDGCVEFAPDTPEYREELAMCDERLMESFADGRDFAVDDIRAAVAGRRLFFVYFGSALKGDGVVELLDGIADHCPLPHYGSEFGARVYKITQDTNGDRLTHLKLTGGSLKVRDELSGRTAGGGDWSEKITQIRIYSGEKYRSVSEVTAGCVCTVAGLSYTYPGEGLGFETDSSAALLEPILDCLAILPDGVDTHTALTRFRLLEDEEPQLRIEWNERLQEIHFHVMGEIQLEVLHRVILDRFGWDVCFGEGSIAYKETIAEPVIGVGHFEPLRHYAEVQLLLEPGARGSGVVISSDCSVNDLDRNWQRLILSHLHEKTHVGVLTGSPISDIKITLIAGRAHKKHTEGGDFREATYRAVRQGLRSAKSILLEPWYNFRLELPSDTIGRAAHDLSRMGARFDMPDVTGELAVITGSAPAAAMRGYNRELSGYSRGKGRLSVSLRGYEECANPDEVIAEIGYDPDRDIDNPADSVFCVNGSGNIISWDKVNEYKHIDCGDEFCREDEAEFNERCERYLKTVADDNELLRIFEMTYGPVRRKTYTEPKRKAPSPKRSTIVTAPRAPQKEYLLIDGYNIIFAWDELRTLANKSLDLARGELINRLCSFQAVKGCEIILVFDAYKVRQNPGSIERIHNISVVYTKEAETADSYIEKTAHELAQNYRVRVATSDGTEQLIILGSGAVRLSARLFHAELAEVEAQLHEFIESMR